jgi:hypothetical protein
MTLRYTEDGERRLLQRLREESEAKRSIAGRMYPPTEIKQGPVHGWGKASESLHRARGATSPLGGQAKK